MEQKKGQNRLSIISEIAIFLGIVLITILVLKELNITEQQSYIDTSQVLYQDNIEKLIQENKNDIKYLKKEYGIMLYYGEDVKNFATKMDAVEQYDTKIIHQNLQVIIEALKKYPSSLFDMVKSKKYPLYIMLVDKFNNNNIALASKNSLNVFRIYLSNTDNLERAFHHEMYHILEYEMTDKNQNIYMFWNRLNPKGFEYPNDVSLLNQVYVYPSGNGEKAYFVSKYAKMTAKEDRAEIFAELMMMQKKSAYLEEGEPIFKKVNEVIETLHQNITYDNFYCDYILK